MQASSCPGLLRTCINELDNGGSADIATTGFAILTKLDDGLCVNKRVCRNLSNNGC